MPIEIFSLILSAGVLLIAADTIIHAILYFTYPRFRTWLLSRPYFNYMKIVGALAISSTVLALTYQLYYLLPVCVLCWWQRIFIFPIDVIVLTSIYMKNKMNHITIGILAAFGAGIAAYHYYYHFQAWVLGNAVSLPCEQGGLLPGCIENHGILTFGFVTIPFMALVVLLSIIWWCFVAHKVSKK
jgi:disulfide bond formation protein DsbB